MLRQKLLIRVKKLFIVSAGFLFLFVTCPFINAQSNAKPLTVCEILQNKKKYNGRKVVMEGFLEIAPETSTFKFEEPCPVIEIIAVGNDSSFRPDDDFEKATDLLSLQTKGEKKLGFSLRWSVFLRVKIRAEGILRISNKPKYGHLNSYKNLFLITEVEEIGQSQLIPIADIFSKNPEVIITSDID